MQHSDLPGLNDPPARNGAYGFTSDVGPSSAAPRWNALGKSSEPPTLHGCRVVLVEDEVLVAMDIEDSLVDAGAVVLGPVGSVEASLDLVESTEDIDAAILDINLGGQDVFPVAQVLTDRGVPFVFHTGHGPDLEIKTRFPAAGVCKKPITIDGLLSALAAQLTPKH